MAKIIVWIVLKTWKKCKRMKMETNNGIDFAHTAKNGSLYKMDTGVGK